MKPPYMQDFMSDRSIREVSIGRSKELNALGFDDNRERPLTSSSAFILLRVGNYVDYDTRTGLYVKDELLDWLTKTGKILGLHMQTLRDVG
jgi:hypothetical protein